MRWSEIVARSVAQLPIDLAAANRWTHMHGGRAARSLRILANWSIPVLLSLVFVGLFALANPIIHDEYNTVSSAEAILALDSYGRAMKQSFLSDSMEVDEVTGNTSKKLDLSPGLYPEAKIDADADALVFKKSSNNQALPGLLPGDRKRIRECRGHEANERGH